MDERAHLGTLVETMAGWGAGPAVVEHRGVRRFRTNYGELASLAHRCAAELERRGIGPGDRVLLAGANSAEWVAAFFGCVLRGVLAVPLDASGPAAFAEKVARETGPRLLVGEPALPGLPQMPLANLRGLANRRATSVALGPETPLQILFTSGTTGTPKGVVHTHGNLLASFGPIEREIAKYRKYERWVHPLRIAHTLPLSHVFGQFMGLWIAPVLGAAVHYESRPGEVLDLLGQERIHVLAAVPRTLALLRARLLEAFPGLEQAGVEPLPIAARWWRYRAVHRRLGWRFWAAVCGGATLPESLERFWTGLGCALVQGYGLTETSALVTLNHPFRTARGSLGMPLPGRSLRVVEDGELEVAGAMVAAGTWENGRVTARTIPWLRTGDLAALGEDGRLRFRGRTGQRLVTAAGLNVYLEDVEQALEAQPGVREAAVFGLPGIGGGEEPAAVLVGPPDAVEKANAGLAPHQQVRRWWPWPEPRLPRTASGKVRRAEVEAWARAQDSSAPATSSQDAAERLLVSLGLRPGPAGDEARLDEDWGLDSMGRVALAAALEDAGDFEGVRTLGELRRALRGGSAENAVASVQPFGMAPAERMVSAAEQGSAANIDPAQAVPLPSQPAQAAASGAGRADRRAYPRPSFPEWPFRPPVRWLRMLFTEAVLRPLVAVFARPRVAGPVPRQGPLLVIANHRTAIDAALVVSALPFPVRSRVAVAMSGELLLGWANSWNHSPLPEAAARERRWWGPLAAVLVRALFGAFPLPRTSGFRRGFAFAGCRLDRGDSVLLFPQGRRAQAGEPIHFRPGLGILAGESFVPVLPVGITIPGRRGISLRTGAADQFEDSPEAVTRHWEGVVAALLATTTKTAP